MSPPTTATTSEHLLSPPAPPLSEAVDCGPFDVLNAAC